MHNAPPVSYPVGRSVVHALVSLLLWSVGFTLWLLWCAQASPLNWRQGLGGACLLGLGGMAWRSWQSAPQGVLNWTGQTWLWRADLAAEPCEGLVKPALDWQGGLLLQFQSQTGAGLWLWLARSSQPRRWADLRRAVYSHARLSPLPGAPSPG